MPETRSKLPSTNSLRMKKSMNSCRESVIAVKKHATTRSTGSAVSVLSMHPSSRNRKKFLPKKNQHRQKSLSLRRLLKKFLKKQLRRPSKSSLKKLPRLVRRSVTKLQTS